MNFARHVPRVTISIHRPAIVTARTTQETHNPRISAQTVRNRLREIGVRSRRPYAFIHSGGFYLTLYIDIGQFCISNTTVKTYADLIVNSNCLNRD